MSCTAPLSTADPPPPSARRVPRPNRGDGWNTLADIEVFIFAVEAELEAMDRERVGVQRRGRKPDLALRRRLIGLIWTLTDRKSTRLNSSHANISYAVFCLKKKKR